MSQSSIKTGKKARKRNNDEDLELDAALNFSLDKLKSLQDVMFVQPEIALDEKKVEEKTLSDSQKNSDSVSSFKNYSTGSLKKN